MESLLENLKKQVTCSICLDTYTEPKTISCLHTFCCECLEKHARASHRQGKFRCPECQAEIDLPEGNRFDRLPNSFFHKSLLSLLAVRQSGDASSITCSQCRKTNPQMYYCFDCGRFMCPDCFNAHEVLKKSFQGHKVTSVKDFKAEDYEALLKRQPFCSQPFHEREVARFFCFQCEAFICQICTAKDHRNHDFDLLDKAAHHQKDYILSGAKMIKNKKGEFSEVIKQFDETIAKLEINIATAKRGVSQAAEQMIAEIRGSEREAIESLETTRVSRLERINSAKQEVESLVKKMNQAAEFAENLVKRSSSTDIMQNKETLKLKFEELRGVEVPKHHQTTFAKFTAASQQDLKLGFIQVIDDKANATESTLEGLDQTLQAGVEAEFTLCPKTSEGKMSNQAELKDQVEFLIEPANDVTIVIASEKEDGNLQLKFTPKVPGAYSIEVKINGDKLPTCPFTVQVKERELVVVGELDLKFFPGHTLQGLYGIAVNEKGEIVVTDNIVCCVYVFDKYGNCVTKMGSEGTNPGKFQYPDGVSYLNDNEVLIADYDNNRIQQVDIQTGTFVKSFGKFGTGKGEFKMPLDVCLDDEERIVVTEFGNNRIQMMSKEGESILTFGESGPEKLYGPTSCIPYKNSNNRVQQFSLDGRFTGKSITQIQKPIGIVTTPGGRILVTSAAKKVYILK